MKPVLLSATLIATLWTSTAFAQNDTAEPIRIGVLHSQPSSTA